MEIIDEHGELCAFCSDDPQDFIHIPPVEAIRLLTLKYIEQCGVSLGMRTLYYNAAEAWQEILASTPNHPLAKPAEELMLYELMPMICEAYKPELYDKYDITYLDDDKLLARLRRTNSRSTRIACFQYQVVKVLQTAKSGGL